MGAMRWMRKWAGYREDVPVQVQVVVVLALMLVVGVIAVYELRQEAMEQEAQRKALVERVERDLGVAVHIRFR